MANMIAFTTSLLQVWDWHTQSSGIANIPVKPRMAEYLNIYSHLRLKQDTPRNKQSLQRYMIKKSLPTGIKSSAASFYYRYILLIEELFLNCLASLENVSTIKMSTRPVGSYTMAFSWSLMQSIWERMI